MREARRILGAGLGLALLLAAACSGEPEDLDRVMDDPNVLKGMTGARVLALFGEPAFRRRDRDARIWQYSASGCWLDLFLYPSENREGGALAVAHVEFRARDGRALVRKACVLEIAEAKAAPG